MVRGKMAEKSLENVSGVLMDTNYKKEKKEEVIYGKPNILISVVFIDHNTVCKPEKSLKAKKWRNVKTGLF